MTMLGCACGLGPGLEVERDMLGQENAALIDDLERLIAAVDGARARSWVDVDTMRAFIDALEAARATVAALDKEQTP